MKEKHTLFPAPPHPPKKSCLNYLIDYLCIYRTKLAMPYSSIHYNKYLLSVYCVPSNLGIVNEVNMDLSLKELIV